MTDQLREQIADYFAQQASTTLEESKGKRGYAYYVLEVGKHVYYTQADEIIAIIKEAGYRKMPSGEPPLLSPEEIYHILPDHMKGWHSFSTRDDLSPIAKAQHVICTAFYAGQKPDQEKR